MKRETPKEVWLFHHRTSGWDFSFDPPLSRHLPQTHRMVPADSHAALRAEVARLREAHRRVARCLVTPNPGITDTIWMDAKSPGPTLYEYVCGVLDEEVKP